MDMTARVNDLIFICERMIEILSKENTALKKHEGFQIKEKLEEKTQLSLFYERHMKSIQKKPGCFKEVDEDTRNTLRELGKEMQDLLDENGRLLKVAMESNRKFLTRVAEAAQEHAPHSGNYANNAKAGPQGTYAAPVSLNQEL
jgi:peptidoglycan hydrolase CwlO-like protein